MAYLRINKDPFYPVVLGLLTPEKFQEQKEIAKHPPISQHRVGRILRCLEFEGKVDIAVVRNSYLSSPRAMQGKVIDFRLRVNSQKPFAGIPTTHRD